MMIRAEERSIRMAVIIIYLAVFAGGFGVVLLEECLKEYRRQTRGLTLDEQFQRTMADLDRGCSREHQYGCCETAAGVQEDGRTKAAQR